MCQIIFSDFRPCWFKNAFEPSQECKWEDDFSEAGVPEISPEIIGVLPDEVRKCCRPPFPFSTMSSSNHILHETEYQIGRRNQPCIARYEVLMPDLRFSGFNPEMQIAKF